jgi:copper chaperone CopZ
MSQTINLKIHGMHCASCEKLIKSELSEIPGVKSSKIDYSAGKGTIKTDDSVQASEVLDVIKKAGYHAEIDDPGQTDKAPEAQSIIINRKTVPANAPFKIRLESVTEADGEFTQKDTKPSFEGKITQTKRGEVEIPRGHKDLAQIAENLFSDAKLNQLLGVFTGIPDSRSAKAEQMPHI